MSELEKYAQQIVNTIPSPLLLLNGGARVRVANAAYYRDFGGTPETTIGHPMWELQGGQWDVAELRTLVNEILPEQTTIEGYDLRYEAAGRETRWLRLGARELESGGTERLVLLTIQDVTLEQDADAVLNRRLAELVESNEALSHFAGMTAHDLREPLRKVRSFGELLLRSAGPKLDATEREHLSRMLAATERLAQLIDASLALARVSTGAVRPRRVSLGALVDDVLADMDAVVRDAQATVEVEPLPVADVDPALLRAVFQNLFANALKFRHPDVAPRVRVTARETDDRIAVRITDNGIGFEPADAERIFEPFLRLHARDAYDGSGIGLAVCRRVLERHKGSITALGVPGSGATFVLTLPKDRPHD